MALYVTRFLEKQGLKATDFVDSEIALTTQQSPPRNVYILVTQDICPTRRFLITLVNESARTFGFIFVVEDRSLDADADAAQVVEDSKSLVKVCVPS
jgi:hypothetical protein